MKKLIIFFLAVNFIISLASPTFASEFSNEDYYTIQVEYSDNLGQQEPLNVMVHNGNVFVDAKMLAERLGYTFGEKGENVAITNTDRNNSLPFGITLFSYNSTQVSHMIFNNFIDTYQAPFSSVKNSKGSWIPLEFSLLLLNSGMAIADDTLLIDIPTKKMVDLFCDIRENSAKYIFDWAGDFGYTQTDINVIAESSHLVNVFNGVLNFDGASWASLFQQFAGSMASYDNKYGQTLALLLCTESNKELQATIDNVELLTDLLDEDGTLGKILSSSSDIQDLQVGALYKNCESILNKIRSDNSPLISYNKSYQALEDALDKQTWFSNTGGIIFDAQKNLSRTAGKAFTFLDIGTKVLKVAGYAKEFQNQDDFSLSALSYYLATANNGLELPEQMKQSMIDYSDTLSSNIGNYMTKRFFNNIDQWVVDAVNSGVGLPKILGGQAAGALLAWDIASNTIPFITNGLSGAESFELALYALVFQADTYQNYLYKRDTIFSDTDNITAQNLYNLSQYCYVFLKSCYITRESAIASLANKLKSTKEKIQPLIDYENNINIEIAKILVELKNANVDNDGLVFGFLPTDNFLYLSEYNDSGLIRWIETFNKNNIDISSFVLTEEHQFYIKWWLQGIFTDKNSRYGQAATVFSFRKDSVPASVWNGNLILYIGFNKLNDPRIGEEAGQYGMNKVFTRDALREIAREITGSSDEAYLASVIADIGKQDGDRLVFYPVGLIGDTGPFYFKEIIGWSVEKDKLTVSGNIEMMSGSHEVMPFTATFSVGNPQAPMPWVFETLDVKPGSAGSAAASPSEYEIYPNAKGHYYASDTLTMRPGPSLDSGEIMKVPKDSTVLVIDFGDKGFYHIYYAGKEGYVVSPYLSASGDAILQQAVGTLTIKQDAPLYGWPRPSTSEVITQIPAGSEVDYFCDSENGTKFVIYDREYKGFIPESSLQGSTASGSSSGNIAATGWQEGYYNYLRDNYSYQEYPPAFGLLYVDNDDIPELAVGFNGTGRYVQVELFCWYNGSVKKLGDVGSFSSFSFVEKGNLIRNSLPVSSFHGHTLVQKIENGELKTIYEFEIKPAENYSGNIEDNLENYMGEYGTSLKKCSESEYDAKMDAYFPSGKTKSTPYLMDGYKYRANSSDIVLLTTNPQAVTF